jgi:uncharacterized protein YndB with AHSA1/START domain
MKIALVSLGVVVALILVVIAVGYMLPVAHTATRERTLGAPPSRVFAAIMTPADFPQWRSDVKRVEMLPAVDGHTRWRETGDNGTITFVNDTVVPDRRVVTRIEDKGLPFGGGWTLELSPAPQAGGTTLRITENGKIYNPVFRFVSRFILGYTRSLERYLGDLERYLAR